MLINLIRKVPKLLWDVNFVLYFLYVKLVGYLDKINVSVKIAGDFAFITGYEASVRNAVEVHYVKLQIVKLVKIKNTRDIVLLKFPKTLVIDLLLLDLIRTTM
jgi:hypothetical protein